MMLNYLKARWKVSKGTNPALLIDSEDTEHGPLEQRIIRLEKGRDRDFEFLSDYINNLKERVEKLEANKGFPRGPIA